MSNSRYSELTSLTEYQLFERRFGNTVEASQIYDLLKLKIAYLTGGKSEKQGPLILFPSSSGVGKTSEQDVITCLKEVSAKRGFTIIIDNKTNLYNNLLNFVLLCCQKAYGSALSEVYVVDDLVKKQFNIDPQITPAKFIESYNKEMKNMLLEMDQFTKGATNVILQSTSFQRPSQQLSSSSSSHYLDLQALWNDYEVVRNNCLALIAKGIDFMKGRHTPTEDEFIIKDRTNRLVKSLEEKLNRLEGVWRFKEGEERRRSDYYELQSNIKTVIDWILGPGEKLLMSNTSIGRSLEEADQLRRHQEQLELKCLDSYGRYAELRHKVEEYVANTNNNNTNTSTNNMNNDLTELLALKDRMDKVCKDFASRLETRRNLVVSSVRFYKLIKEILLTLNDLLLLMNRDITHNELEQIVDQFNNKVDQMDLKLMMAEREGVTLVGELSNPPPHLQPIQNINRVDDVRYVESCLQQINQELSNNRNDINFRKLQLKQMLQLKVCEDNVEQAIVWIQELNDILNSEVESQSLAFNQPPTSQLSINRLPTLQQLEETKEKLNKGEKTALDSYEYGQKNLQAALYLRRSMQEDTEVNLDQADRLHDVWMTFKKGVSERAARRNDLAIFDLKSNQFLTATDQLLNKLIMNKTSTISVPRPPLTTANDSNKEVLKDFLKRRRVLENSHKQLREEGQHLHQRFQKPLLVGQGDEKKIKFEDSEMIERVRERLRKMDERMTELAGRWDIDGMVSEDVQQNSTIRGPQPLSQSRQGSSKIPSQQNVAHIGMKNMMKNNVNNNMNNNVNNNMNKNVNNYNNMNYYAGSDGTGKGGSQLRDDSFNEYKYVENQLRSWLGGHVMNELSTCNIIGQTQESAEFFSNRHRKLLRDIETNEDDLMRCPRNKQVQQVDQVLLQQVRFVKGLVANRIQFASSFAEYLLLLQKASSFVSLMEGNGKQQTTGSIQDNAMFEKDVSLIKSLDEYEGKLARHAQLVFNWADHHKLKEDSNFDCNPSINFVVQSFNDWKAKKEQLKSEFFERRRAKNEFNSRAINDKSQNNMENSFSLELNKVMSTFSNLTLQLNEDIEDLNNQLTGSSPSTRNMGAINDQLFRIQNNLDRLQQSKQASQFRNELHNLKKNVEGLKTFVARAVHFDVLSQNFSLDQKVPSGDNKINLFGQHLEPVRNVNIRKGEVLRLSSKLNLFPYVGHQIKWFKNEREIMRDDERYRYNDVEGASRSELVLEDVDDDDVGVYSCVVVGDGRRQIDVADVFQVSVQDFTDPHASILGHLFPPFPFVNQCCNSCLFKGACCQDTDELAMFRTTFPEENSASINTLSSGAGTEHYRSFQWMSYVHLTDCLRADLWLNTSIGILHLYPSPLLNHRRILSLQQLSSMNCLKWKMFGVRHAVLLHKVDLIRQNGLRRDDQPSGRISLGGTVV
ncbi:hypothetical protein HELRODRAFT_170138 [Helobdella robusta]|uniref:Ig-like domain-containing protein n=1 Tax=Helobdella robusta TaxID=6412 RepID=T1F2P5_HELRO|nr:hypothetical protein HELRODRAFT_170138 [Helobdella robusta]ESO07590.1 hypothetical protein HELRODRAFT_170138 [Helobdella robusta]